MFPIFLMPLLFKTLLTYLNDSDEVRQLHKFDLTLSCYGSPNIGNTSTETYSIFLEDKLLTIFIVGFTEDYRDRLIAKVSFDNQYEFKSVIKHIKRGNASRLRKPENSINIRKRRF